MVGCLSYIASGTCPPNELSRYQSNANDKHYAIGKKVLRYLKGTKDRKLFFNGKGENCLEVYSDASFVCDNDQKSTSGIFIRFYGDAILLNTKAQGDLVDSSGLSEYVAMYEAIKAGLGVRNFLCELMKSDMHSIPLFCDALAAIFSIH